MGRKSREKKERRKENIARLEEKIKSMAGGNAFLWSSGNCPHESRESELEDIISFESVDTGTSLFDGLQQHGLDLPHPENLNEEQSGRKVREIMDALAGLRVFLAGYSHLTMRRLYAMLWHKTLWEGCYIERKNPDGMTLIDVSHKISPFESIECLEAMAKADTIH